MQVRILNTEVAGQASHFNINALGEVIMGFDDGSADSMFISDLEVKLSTGEWKDMRQAFKDRDLIPDNYNTWFSEPKTDEDRMRGYFL